MTGEVWAFTGTRFDPTEAQLRWFKKMLIEHRPSELRHGACVGADEQSHKLALILLGPNIHIFVHPPIDGSRMMVPDWNYPNVDVLPHRPYHKRNRDIVNGIPAYGQKPVDRLLAMPNSGWKPLGGSWYTVDFACGKKDRYALKRKVPVTVCLPDGTLEWY